MNEYVYSARHNAFFPVDMIDKYKSEGWDLSDAKVCEKTSYILSTQISQRIVQRLFTC